MTSRNVELKLYAYRKSKDGLIISFVVHPNDEQQLLGIDIGDTFDAVLTENGDGPTRKDGQFSAGNDSSRPLLRSDGDRDGARTHQGPEKPVAPKPPGPAPSDGERIRTRAVMLCKDVEFQDWIGVTASVGSTAADHEREAAKMLCEALGIQSRAEIATNPEAQKRLLLLEAHWRSE